MRPDARLLVIGPNRFRKAAGRALPHCERVDTGQPLAGVWKAGQQAFEGVLLSLATSRKPTRVIRSLRQVSPASRIVVACAPTAEPNAREALRAGADEYVIEPLTRVELERAFDIPPSPAAQPKAVPISAGFDEQGQLAQIIKSLAEGPESALRRMAELLKATFEASYVVVEMRQMLATAGSAGEPVLQEPIRCQGAQVGMVALGRCKRGSYDASVAARLADYARLIEAVATVAGERVHWQNLAWTDDLSHLRNRRYFDQRCDELLAECARQRLHLTVLLLDLDGFKSYNDRLGHETGDALIREVAYLLTHCSRESDIVARYGGDEFAIMFWDAEKARVPGSRHPVDPLAFAERFCQTIRTHSFRCLGPNAPGEVTVSGGLATFPWDGTTREQLMRAADAALLEAKRTGKNRIKLATSGPNGTAAVQTDETSQPDQALG
jgi:diguanylate cyclase (GGDEF)-like protein